MILGLIALALVILLEAWILREERAQKRRHERTGRRI